MFVKTWWSSENVDYELNKSFNVGGNAPKYSEKYKK